MTTADKHREHYLSAATAYFDEVTSATSRARADAQHHALRAGMPDEQVRAWDDEAARNVLGRGFPRP